MTRRSPRRSRRGLAGTLLVLATLALTWPVPRLPGPDRLLAAVAAREEARRAPGPSRMRPPGR